MTYHQWHGVILQSQFQDPLPIEPWPGIKDATSYGPMCAQKDFITREVQGGDDCLYLNVYVKSIEPDERLPVMVWIHGGAFMHGSGDDLLYGPDYLLRKDIVLVTFNYRVGVLGMCVQYFNHSTFSININIFFHFIEVGK